METLGHELAFNAHRPIPHAVLKVHVNHLVAQHASNKEGVICTRDLLTIIEAYEKQHDAVLLTSDQKTAILPYCLANPDLEMTSTDILNLLKLVFPPQLLQSTSTPTNCRYGNDEAAVDNEAGQDEFLSVARPRSSAPLGTRSIPWKRRPSVLAMARQHEKSLFYTTLESPTEPSMTLAEPSIVVTPTDHQDTPSKDTVEDETAAEHMEHMEHMDEDPTQQDTSSFYRKSMELTKRLKLSERNLDSMTRDNEDRIVYLQNSVDDMKTEVQKQRREIQEYKSKEKNSLEQISALEAHIDRIEKSETDQKQVYLSIKRLFDEKCEETQKLQEMLRQKELELQKTEALLSSIQHEFQQSTQERNKLQALRKILEHELTTSHNTHLQLEEQRHENQRLKEIIDSLKLDLETRNELTDPTLPADKEVQLLVKTLEDELETDLHIREAEDKNQDNELDTEERLKSVEHEKDYYKLRANEAIEDLNKAKNELRHLKRVLESENRSLVNELADLQTRQSEQKDELGDEKPDESANIDGLEPLAIHFEHQEDGAELTDTTIDINIPSTGQDIWAQSRIRLRKPDKGKKLRAGFQDLNESTANMVKPSPAQDTQVLARPNDKAVTNTVTFALYTLLVYIFGIVTSTFLLENGQSGGWEQALVAAASRQGGGRSNVLDILIYWFEKLLFEGEGFPLS